MLLNMNEFKSLILSVIFDEKLCNFLIDDSYARNISKSRDEKKEEDEDNNNKSKNSSES